jgi:RND family efflux transporter MFP subunit
MKLIIKLTYIVILAASFLACSSEEKKTVSETSFLPLVEIETADVKPFKHTINAQGNVETDQDILLTAEMGGLITKVNVKSGDRVAAGQTLVLLDAALINSGAQEIETQLEYAEYMLKKQEELKSKGVGSEFDYETARNAVKSLRAKLNSLNTQRGKSAIKAPFSGIIDVVYAKQGQMAGPQSPLLRLVNNSNVEITASISEKHLNKIKVGTLIEVSFPNFNNTILNLKVNTVGNFIEPTNRTFRIAAKVSGNKELLPNMLAELRITDFTVENGFVIPAKSILKSQDNSDYVWVALPSSKGNFKVKKIAVELIENQDGEALIKDNAAIKNGTKIIVEGARGITEKDQVRIK